MPSLEESSKICHSTYSSEKELIIESNDDLNVEIIIDELNNIDYGSPDTLTISRPGTGLCREKSDKANTSVNLLQRRPSDRRNKKTSNENQNELKESSICNTESFKSDDNIASLTPNLNSLSEHNTEHQISDISKSSSRSCTHELPMNKSERNDSAVKLVLLESFCDEFKHIEREFFRSMPNTHKIIKVLQF